MTISSLTSAGLHARMDSTHPRARQGRLGGLVGRCGDPVLEGYRRDVAERAVTPEVVVDGVDPAADGVDRLSSGRELMPLVELGFQGRPETLLSALSQHTPVCPTESRCMTRREGPRAQIPNIRSGVQ